MGNQFIMPKQVFYGENALKDAADVASQSIESQSTSSGFQSHISSRNK